MPRLRVCILIAVAALLVLPAALMPLYTLVDEPGSADAERGGSGGILVAGHRVTWHKLLLRLTQSRLTGTPPADPPPRIDPGSWFDRGFQKGFEAWLGTRILFREPLVRLNNEFYLRAFAKSYMYNQLIIPGKAGQLYELPYIAEYCGLTAPDGEEASERLARRLEEARAKLNRLGRELVLVLAPHKAETLPQYLPSRFCRRPAESRLADRLLPRLRQAGVPFVDGPAELRRASEAQPAAPFARGGTHWNVLGAYEIARPLVALLRDRGVPVELPAADNIVVDRRPTGMDLDLANLVNRAFPGSDYDVPHLHFRAPAGANAPRPTLLLVGDSFGFQLADVLDQSQVFGKIRYFFYYTAGSYEYPSRKASRIDRREANWDRELSAASALVVIGTAVTLTNEAYLNFLDDLIAR